MATKEQIGVALQELLTPSVPLIIKKKFANGREVEYGFQISFDFNACALVEKETGLSMLTGEVFNTPTAIVVSALLWAGVQENHPEYEGEKGLRFIRRLLNPISAKKTLEAVNKAWLLSLPDDVREDIEKRAAAKAAGNPGEPPEADPTTAV